MRYKMRDTVKSLEVSPEELRKMQMNMLELLIEFDRICRKYNIKYSLDGGTFLGAVRHKGFIPWDPDADVVIMRDDYIRFKAACNKEMKHDKFFLQDYKTDLNYRWGYARLLRKNTEFRRAGHEHIKAQNGIFIDIFTMDSVPDSYIMRRLHKFICFCIRKILWSEVGRKVHPNWLLRKWYDLCAIIPRNSVFNLRDKIAEKCNRNKETELIRHMCSPHPKKYSYGFPRKLFDELDEYEFEGHKFLAFKDYDWYLKSIYDNYMVPPPVEMRGSHIPCSYYKVTTPEFDD